MCFIVVSFTTLVQAFCGTIWSKLACHSFLVQIQPVFSALQSLEVSPVLGPCNTSHTLGMSCRRVSTLQRSILDPRPVRSSPYFSAASHHIIHNHQKPRIVHSHRSLELETVKVHNLILGSFDAAHPVLGPRGHGLTSSKRHTQRR